MITTINDGKINIFYGLSTDTKPSGEKLNGSIFYEMDTKKVYMYDETGTTWREQ